MMKEYRVTMKSPYDPVMFGTLMNTNEKDNYSPMMVPYFSYRVSRFMILMHMK